MRGAPCGQRFVVDLDHVCSEVAFRPVPERVDADGLDIDALGVHLADAAQADFADPRTAALVGAGCATHEFQCLGYHAVCVHVDGLHTAPADHHFPAARRRLRLGLCLLWWLGLYRLHARTARIPNARALVASVAASLHALLPAQVVPARHVANPLLPATFSPGYHALRIEGIRMPQAIVGLVPPEYNPQNHP